MNDQSQVKELGEEACWRLVGAVDFGRLVVNSKSGAPLVFPMNYLVHDGSVYLRSAPGSKLERITHDPSVAFEVDGRAGDDFWSVVVQGQATRLAADDEILDSGVLDLDSASPTSKQNFIRIAPTGVTGRRFPQPPGQDLPATAARPFGGERPTTIPHFPPLTDR